MDNNETTTAPDGQPPVAAAAAAAAPPPAEASAPEHQAGPDARGDGAPGGDARDLGGDEGGEGGEGDVAGDPTVRPANRKRRRGSRGGKNRKRPATAGENADDADDDGDDDADDDATAAPDEHDARAVVQRPARQRQPRPATTAGTEQDELPERISENRPSAAAADQALVRKPQIGDTRPAPATPPPGPASGAPAAAKPKPAKQAKQPRGGTAAERGGVARQDNSGSAQAAATASDVDADGKKKRRRGGKGRTATAVTGRGTPGPVAELDADVLERRRGRERNGRPIGRYLMCVQVRPSLTQVAVLEGRNLIEHYVSRPADDVGQIHGNIYVGKVQNVLPGMEAAFVDIGTPKNAVLYRGDVQYNEEDIVEKSSQPRIEQMLRAKQLIVCQVTKNPIGAKGARLTQEVSLPGRFVVLIPNSKTYGISKRLPDDVRKRLRNILDRVKPAEHGLIVRTAAEHATEHELRADMTRLLDQWNAIEAKAKKAQGPALLYREPELAVRVIREEFNAEYRGVVIDDQRLFEDVRDYVGAFNPELADRVEYFDAVEDGLPLFERFHIHEQLHKALDRKVWLPSGGSLIIEHTEALTVIDVNTGKNVGTTNLEETVFRNNLEAAEEVAKQLRLRDIGGIVVIDFIDMEIKDNRRKVVDAFRSALARDKTRTQVFDISELGLVEMTRKRIGEGLLVNFADQCPNCQGRGVVIDTALLE